MGIDRPNLGFARLRTPADFYYFTLVVCVVLVILVKRLEQSRLGLAWNAIREDEGAAKAMGVNTNRMKLLACVLGAVPEGLAGVLFAGIQTYISPVSFAMDESIFMLSMVLVGGLGSVPGVILGALLLNILPEPLREYTEAYRMLIYGGLLVVFAIFRPQGIWPRSHKVQQQESPPTAVERRTRIEASHCRRSRWPTRRTSSHELQQDKPEIKADRRRRGTSLLRVQGYVEALWRPEGRRASQL